MLLHILSAAMIFPGAALFNAAAHRFFPSRTWTDDPRRPRLAGLLSVPLVWGLPALLAAFGIESEKTLERTFGVGWIEAWILAIGGQMLLGSALCLMAAWSLPPKPAVRIVRSPVD